MYYTVHDVERQLKLSRRSVYRMIKAGRLKAAKVGKEWRIPEESISRLLGEATGAAEQGAVYSAPVVPPRWDSQVDGFMTAEEFLSLPEESTTSHLIQGFLIRDPGATAPHQELVTRLILLLGTAIQQEGIGFVYTAPLDVVLDVDTVLEPDLLVISKERRQIIGDRVRGAPDLVVEIASPSTVERDLTTKRILYARYGVGEYWFVSGYDRMLIQFWQPKGDHYRQRTTHEAPAKVRSVRFPNVTVGLGELFDEYTG